MNAEIPSQIILPEVPDDFNGGVGLAFARELLKLIGQATIQLNPVTNPDSFDAAKLIQTVVTLQTNFDAQHRQIRMVTVGAVTDDDIVVNFPDIGTQDYTVIPILLVTGGATVVAYNIYEIIGSKTNNSVKLHCKGAINPHNIQVTIIENKSDT